MSTISVANEVTNVAHGPEAADGLAIVRVTIGAMFVWVFFENLGKGLYNPAGYAGLIDYYLKNSHGTEKLPDFSKLPTSGSGSPRLTRSLLKA